MVLVVGLPAASASLQGPPGSGGLREPPGAFGGPGAPNPPSAFADQDVGFGNGFRVLFGLPALLLPGRT